MKNILIVFLSLLSITTFGQVHSSHQIGKPITPGIGLTFNNGLIQADTIIIVNTTIAQIRALTTVSPNYWYHTTDIDGYWFYNPSDTRSDNTATVLVTAGAQHFNRSYTGSVHDTWWGIIHDGITPCKTQLRNMFNTCSNLGDIIVSNGTVNVGDTMTIPYMQHVHFKGSTWDSSKFVNNGSNPGLFYPQGGIDVSFEAMFLYCGTTHTALDYGDGEIYSIGYSYENYSFKDVQFSNPNANMTAVDILVQNAASGFATGHLDQINFKHCFFNNIGEACIAIMNRDTITAHNKDSCRNVHIEDCIFKHTGLSGSYGFAITYDGVGRNVNFKNNYLIDMFGVAVENTGYDYSYFGHNTIEASPRGATFFGFSTRNMYNNTIEYNFCADTISGGNSFNQVFNSTFTGDIWKCKGFNWNGIRNSSNNVFTNEVWISEYIYAFQAQATVGNTCTGNRFYNCTGDNSAYSGNFATISFDGKGCTNNLFYKTVINKGTGGAFWGLQDTAAVSNFFYDPTVAGNSLYSGYHAVVVPAVTSDTLSAGDDLCNYQVIQLTGGDSVAGHIDTVWFQSLAHSDFKLQNRMTVSACVGLRSGNACAVIYPNQNADLICDGVNTRAYNINTGLPAAVNGVNYATLGAGAFYINNNQLVYPESPTTVGGPTTRAIDSGTFYSAALNTLQFSLTSKTQVLNSAVATSIIGVGHNTPVLPAGWVSYQGRTFDIDGWGFLTMGSTASYATLSFYVGNVGDSVQFVCPISITNAPIEYHIHGLSRTVSGTTATVSMQGKVIVNGVAYSLCNATDYTMNTSLPDTVNMLWTFSTANSSNAFTNHQFTVKSQ